MTPSNERPGDASSSACCAIRSTRRRILRRGAAGALSLGRARLSRRLRHDERRQRQTRHRGARRSPRARSRDTQLRQLAALHRREAHGRSSVPEEVRHQGQVHRGDQRQRRVLRQGPPAVRAGQLGRPRPARRDRLDGRPDEPARLRPEARQVRDAERGQELIDAAESPPFDPKREYSVPWQSGLVGLIYRKDKVQAQAQDVNDLFDPKFKGKVTMLTEMRDTVGLVTAWQGIEPEKATIDQVMEAIDKIEEEVEDGQIRRFTGNEYLEGHPQGRLVDASSAGRATRCSSRPTTRTSSSCSRRGLHDLHRHHADPGRRAARVHGREVHGLRLRPRDPGADRGVRQLRPPGEGHQGGPREDATRSSPRTS